MRFIHTSDWHLGNRLMDCSRHEEFRAFLNWLLDLMSEKKAEALLVSGDIFDSPAPSERTLALYYNFLSRVDSTGCRNTIITGGNHDGMLQLQTSSPLLKRYNAHVISKLQHSETSSCLIPIVGADGSPSALACAVPFLRPMDTALPTPANDEAARKTAYIRGIAALYAKVAAHAEIWKMERPGLPCIAMGHLAVRQAPATPSTRSMIGALDTTSSDIFPSVFDYVALGHIHKEYAMDGGRIRYCGSPLPMGMDEADFPHYVLLVDLETGAPPHVTPIQTPVFTCHTTLSCPSQEDLATLPARLAARSAAYGQAPVRLQLEYTGGDLSVPALHRWLHQHLDPRIVTCWQACCTHSRRYMIETAESEEHSLSLYSPVHIFEMKLAQYAAQHPQTVLIQDTLRSLFLQVLSEMPDTPSHED